MADVLRLTVLVFFMPPIMRRGDWGVKCNAMQKRSGVPLTLIHPGNTLPCMARPRLKTRDQSEQVTVRIRRTTLQKIDSYAAEGRWTRMSAIRNLIEDRLAELGQEPARAR